MIGLEILKVDGIIFQLILLMIVPPILLTLIGFTIKKKKPYLAKGFFSLAVFYLLIGLGICGSLMIL